jgi:hypothetical protein
MRPRTVRWLVVLAALLGADQVVQYTVLRDGKLGGHWVIPFDPPLFTDWQKERAADVAAIASGAAGSEALRASALFDAELGWCPRPGQQYGLYVHDGSGSRLQIAPLLAPSPPPVRRVVTVGCSFTEGAEVAGAETWSALLDARHEDLEVANLGVAGYGVDQAYLRYRRDGRVLEPDEVWLGFLPEATLRITAQFPPTCMHWAPMIDFKPIFVLGPGDEIELVPSPTKDYSAFQVLLADQSAFLAAVGRTDHWVQRTPSAFAPRGSSWMHWFASTRLWVSWRESGDRDSARYLRDPESDVYRLLRAIVLQFERDVREDGARFRMLVLPSRPDLLDARGPDGPPWELFLEDLTARGVECIDTTPALLAVGAAAETSFWMPLGHYTPEGNRVVADALDPALWPQGTAR